MSRVKSRCPNKKNPPPYLKTHGAAGDMFDMETIIKMNPNAFCKSQIKWLRKHPNFFSGNLSMIQCKSQLEAVKKACGKPPPTPKKRPAPKRPKPSKKVQKKLKYGEVQKKADGTKFAVLSETIDTYEPAHPHLQFYHSGKKNDE